MPSSISLAECTDQYCIVRRGQTSEIFVTFKPNATLPAATGSVRAYFAGFWTNFPLGTKANVCKNLSAGKCPIEAGASATYKVGVRIPNGIPADGRVIVEVRVADQQDQSIVCTRISILIQ